MKTTYHVTSEKSASERLFFLQLKFHNDFHLIHFECTYLLVSH